MTASGEARTPTGPVPRSLRGSCEAPPKRCGIKRATNVKDSTVRGRALKAAKGVGLRPGLFDEPVPTFVEPCLATLRANVPAGDKWVHEIKWDGYRLQIRIEDGRVTILTRRG
jgi:bifunctional non-homologous end joining protein LigD